MKQFIEIEYLDHDLNPRRVIVNTCDIIRVMPMESGGSYIELKSMPKDPIKTDYPFETLRKDLLE